LYRHPVLAPPSPYCNTKRNAHHSHRWTELSTSILQNKRNAHHSHQWTQLRTWIWKERLGHSWGQSSVSWCGGSSWGGLGWGDASDDLEERWRGHVDKLVLASKVRQWASPETTGFMGWWQRASDLQWRWPWYSETCGDSVVSEAGAWARCTSMEIPRRRPWAEKSPWFSHYLWFILDLWFPCVYDFFHWSLQYLFGH
jgi:hypothetical protein